MANTTTTQGRRSHATEDVFAQERVATLQAQVLCKQQHGYGEREQREGTEEQP